MNGVGAVAAAAGGRGRDEACGGDWVEGRGGRADTCGGDWVEGLGAGECEWISRVVVFLGTQMASAEKDKKIREEMETMTRICLFCSAIFVSLLFFLEDGGLERKGNE